MKRMIRAFLLVLPLSLGIAGAAAIGLIAQTQLAEAGPNP